MIRLAQISDTHLSPGKKHFASNWEPLVAWVESQRPDLIIHTGDVTVDGADVEEDMVYCASALLSLRAPVFCVPGNHDVGEANSPFQPVNGARIARWRRYFGPDYWRHDIEGWRLVGLNSLILGSGDPEEERQFAWLERTLEEAEGRRLAWFMHQPLFIADPEEGDTGYWGVKPVPRKRLLDLVDHHKVALVASGHLHKANDSDFGGVRFIWGPSSGFMVGPALQPKMAGEKRLGAVIYDFGPDGFTASIRDVDGLHAFYIDDVVHEVYPPRRAA
jgi:3',5'-cyclic AMP phosphodiesterase CpdA